MFTQESSNSDTDTSLGLGIENVSPTFSISTSDDVTQWIFQEPTLCKYTHSYQTAQLQSSIEIRQVTSHCPSGKLLSFSDFSVSHCSLIVWLEPSIQWKMQFQTSRISRTSLYYKIWISFIALQMKYMCMQCVCVCVLWLIESSNKRHR